MSKNKKIPKDDSYTWYDFASSYINIAKLACSEMIEHRYDTYSRREETKGKKLTSFTISDLYISTLFNIKHAIEILIKHLYISVKGELADHHHNQKELFYNFKKEYSKKKFELAIKEAKSTLSNERYKILIADIDDSEISFDKIEKMVEKYQSCDFLKEKIGILYKMDDYQNDAFRYPISNFSIQIDYEKLVEKIEVKDIENMKSDVLELEKILGLLNIVFMFYK